MLIVKGGDLVVEVVVCSWRTRIGPAVAAARPSEASPARCTRRRLERCEGGTVASSSPSTTCLRTKRPPPLPSSAPSNSPRPAAAVCRSRQLGGCIVSRCTCCRGLTPRDAGALRPELMFPRLAHLELGERMAVPAPQSPAVAAQCRRRAIISWPSSNSRSERSIQIAFSSASAAITPRSILGQSVQEGERGRAVAPLAHRKSGTPLLACRWP